EAHGHCDVPGEWPENPELGLWVANLRQRPYRLSGLQKRLLNQLGFDWSPSETFWKERLSELEEFKRRFGHCNVPAKWAENSALGTWVYEMRTRGKKAIPSHRRREIETLGFDWEPTRTQWWEAKFQELEAFKNQFGHCNVPKDWPEN